MAAHYCDHSGGCSCCSGALAAAWEAAGRAGLSRRNLLLGAGTAAISSWAVAAKAADTTTTSGSAAAAAFKPSNELVVQPVLTYHLPVRAEQTSWRPWGGLQTAEQVAGEVRQITAELKASTKAAGLKVTVLPVVEVRNMAEAKAAQAAAADVTIVYASGGGADVVASFLNCGRPTIYFLRHKSGPVSLYYEILHPHTFRSATDTYVKGANVQDVVVDIYEDLLWRLRGLLALRKTLGQRIVALGGAAGWGLGHKLAPAIARDVWHLDIVPVTYEDLGQRIQKLNADPKAVEQAKALAADYLKDSGVSLHTERQYIDNAMLLYRAFKEMMADHKATAFTIGHCMSTVMPLSKTTACLPLTLLNDEGLMAFCESDFVVIPSGMLMHHITGRPVFLNDPTWPHHGLVTLAHCTAPRRMNGKTLEPAKIYTHFESDYGAAPKVEMTRGQEVTMVVPDFESKKWVGAKGRIKDNPFHDICRAQIDVSIDGDWEKLVEDMRGFHWMMVYGDCRKEIGYAIRQLGIGWEDVS